MQAVGFAARIRWRKANKFVIARALCARGNLGKAVAILPIAFPRCGRVLRDCHVASLLAMTHQVVLWCTSALLPLNFPVQGAQPP